MFRVAVSTREIEGLAARHFFCLRSIFPYFPRQIASASLKLAIGDYKRKEQKKPPIARAWF